ncbi:MAG: hypothetical protein RJA57_2014 [Bacteroidota bacterium]
MLDPHVNLTLGYPPSPHVPFFHIMSHIGHHLLSGVCIKRDLRKLRYLSIPDLFPKTIIFPLAQLGLPQPTQRRRCRYRSLYLSHFVHDIGRHFFKIRRLIRQYIAIK